MSATHELLAATLPQALDLQVVRGDSFAVTLIVRVGGRLPLTGWSGTATIRRALDDAEVFTLTVDVSQAASGSASCGEVTVSATPSVSVLLPERGVWDVQLTDGSHVKTIVRGAFTLIREVSP